MEDIILKEFLEALKINPVIPCASNYKEIFIDNYKNIRVIYIYDIGILDLLEIKKINEKEKKYIILNIDSLRGISTDEEGADFIKKYLSIDIVSSSSPKLTARFRKRGFLTMQSIFVLDTLSTHKAIKLIEAGNPNIIDLRPGILYMNVRDALVSHFPDIPIVCSGFIDNGEKLKGMLSRGAIGITTSKKDLWELFI